MELYNRAILNRQGIENKYTNKDGNEVETMSDTSRVLIAGRVADVRTGYPTKSGMASAILKLSDEVSTDPDLGDITEPGAIINFYDGQQSNNATNMLKLNPKQNSVVVVKADKSIQTDVASGDVRTNFFGQKIYYPGNAIQIKTNDDGPGVRVIFGYATVKDGSISVPLRQYDRAKAGSPDANYTVFAQVEIEGGVDENALAKTVGEDGKQHAKLVAISVKPTDYKEVSANGRITSITAKASSYTILA